MPEADESLLAAIEQRGDGKFVHNAIGMWAYYRSAIQLSETHRDVSKRAGWATNAKVTEQALRRYLVTGTLDKWEDLPLDRSVYSQQEVKNARTNKKPTNRT